MEMSALRSAGSWTYLYNLSCKTWRTTGVHVLGCLAPIDGYVANDLGHHELVL